ncbi:MAG: hypothetical protein A2Y25_02855 [Candidatus Melainabacteria bacterium GWF2_37_15]|nr:MAG: hypothetical protein A2Y25_02855 [Candidatus Melainabacteria bacterium GWF2_37_15]
MIKFIYYFNIKNMSIPEKIISEIKKARRIAIFHHVAPDGDSLGSALALREMIEQFENVEIVDNIITNYVPELYRFLPDVNKLKRTNDSSLYNAYDLAMAVDCASKERLGDATELFMSAKKSVSIDHHISNSGFADIDFIDTRVSAAGELVFQLVEASGVSFTENMATNLYTAILTDTGGFKFDNTKPETLRICAKLIQEGANPVEIYKNCYELKPLAMVKLQARVINEAVLAENNKIIYGTITRNLLDEEDATDDYIDGITEAMRQVKGIEVAMVFKETLKKTTRVSLRSNGLDVCKIAGYFGGGGHKLAAGCLIDENIEKAVTQVLNVVVQQLHKEEIYS